MDKTTNVDACFVVGKEASNYEETVPKASIPPQKKRKSSPDENIAPKVLVSLDYVEDPDPTMLPPAGCESPKRPKKSETAKTCIASEESQPEPASEQKLVARYYACVWGKCSTRKHKRWEGDGILITEGSFAFLLDLDGNLMEKKRGFQKLDSIEEGSTLVVGQREIEVQNKLPAQEVLSGRCFNVKQPPQETDN